MTTGSGDPHRIHEELEAAEEYQAPPREHERDVETELSSGAGDPVDLPLLEAQQGRGEREMSETKPHPATPPGGTVSGKDELADPDNPRATPPGERM
jgi:hypothetical protein